MRAHLPPIDTTPDDHVGRAFPAIRSTTVVLLAACALSLIGMAQEAPQPSNEDIVRWVRELRTGNKEKRKKARKKLAAAGPLAAGLLVEELDGGATRLRREIVRTLARIDSVDADWALADRAVLDRDAEVSGRALAALKKGRGNSARDRLIELVQGQSPRARRKAVEITRSVCAAEAIDELIRRLAAAPPLPDSKATLHIRATNTDLRGYDDFSTTHRVPVGGGKTRTVTQKHLMPVIGSTTVETTVVVGLSKALKEITGCSFGNDVNKWRLWRHMNRKALDRRKADEPTKPRK
ncbi:MAG: HEAT repeat domain-containing protein [Lentisphaerae bacterium]|jgi:hypothetical protein|nr:HEAT repeat domain-containing protein [Lentisphaerota bacterium]MBT4823346.1 HEAT repeat domain-containing protein [Lentisphaerota bacterium]MBT5611954.1 HEAT repeat domain-containing protein [Lentisphaerota bacterium]MBT7062185.1 HEAT repeat domain-containing protein [Lentisphaerota bacterium]MBT7843721.1 HEAT repeat domain-containing protein [Lentisphaerota bacterium]